MAGVLGGKKKNRFPAKLLAAAAGKKSFGFLLQWDVGKGEEGTAALADCGGYPDWLLLRSSLCKLVCEPLT